MKASASKVVSRSSSTVLIGGRIMFCWPPVPSRQGPHHFDLLALLILGQDTVQREAVVAVLKYHEVHHQLVTETPPQREEASVRTQMISEVEHKDKEVLQIQRHVSTLQDVTTYHCQADGA